MQMRSMKARHDHRCRKCTKYFICQVGDTCELRENSTVYADRPICHKCWPQELVCPCEDDDGTHCDGFNGFKCTLNAGHQGDHIACTGVEHRVSVWAQEQR